MREKDYKKKKYYAKTHLPTTLKEATAWSANRFNAIKTLFPQIYKYKDKRIIEIGASFGGFINNLNRQGFKNVIASDLENVLATQIENKFIYFDITKSKGEFDLMFAFEVLEHISESEKAVQNIYRNLAKDGLFIFTVPYPRKLSLFDPYHINMQYPNYWTNLFKKNGFTLLKFEVVTYIPYMWRYLNLPFFLKGTIEHRIFTSDILYIFKRE